MMKTLFRFNDLWEVVGMVSLKNKPRLLKINKRMLIPYFLFSKQYIDLCSPELQLLTLLKKLGILSKLSFKVVPRSCL